MPDLTDESTAIADALVNDARHLLNIVDTRNERTVDGAVVQLRREMDNIERRLAALRGGLLRDLDVRRRARPQQGEVTVPDPYRLARLHGPDDGEGLPLLSDEDLFERTRHYYWWYLHEPSPLQRWNVSKHFSELRNEVVDRGYQHDSWMDGIDEDEA